MDILDREAPGEVEQDRGEGARAARGDGFGRVFFEGLPSMTAIVTVITQPFAQQSMRAMFGLPAWLPILIALGVSGLLAVYKMRIVRRSAPWECAICAPLLACIIFSGYATGNNVIFYTMEGYTKGDAGGATAESRVNALASERDGLKKQLESAEEVIGQMRRALGLPSAGGKPSSSLPVPTPLLGFLVASEAHAQEPRPKAATDRAGLDATKIRELEKVLQKYETVSRKLTDEIERIKQDERGRPSSQQSIIKSW